MRAGWTAERETRWGGGGVGGRAQRVNSQVLLRCFTKVAGTVSFPRRRKAGLWPEGLRPTAVRGVGLELLRLTRANGSCPSLPESAQRGGWRAASRHSVHLPAPHRLSSPSSQGRGCPGGWSGGRPQASGAFLASEGRAGCGQSWWWVGAARRPLGAGLRGLCRLEVGALLLVSRCSRS